MSKVKVLFVCKGNICRSPAAEAIFASLVVQEKLEDQITVDSCGTHSYHVGEPPDPRMRAHAEKRGYRLESPARKFHSAKDFEESTLIVTMDRFNYEHVLRLSETSEEQAKVVSMCRFCEEHTESEVPDPYYEGPEGFEKVLNILEDASRGLLEHIKRTELQKVTR